MRLGVILLACLLGGCVSQPEEDLMICWARVNGSSMEPTLHCGDIVHVMPIPFEDLREGDVVVYRTVNGTLVSHRIFTRNDHSWYARGDNNPTRDRALVTRMNYVGYVYMADALRRPVAAAQTIQALGVPEG